MSKRVPAPLDHRQAYRGGSLPQVIRELLDLIEAMEQLRDAIRREEGRAAAAATAGLVQAFVATFSHDDEFVREGLNFLARVRRLVHAGKFHEAEAIILAWLVRFHNVAATLAGALRK